MLTLLRAAALTPACAGGGDESGRADPGPRAPVVQPWCSHRGPLRSALTTFGAFEATEEIELAVDLSYASQSQYVSAPYLSLPFLALASTGDAVNDSAKSISRWMSPKPTRRENAMPLLGSSL